MPPAFLRTPLQAVDEQANLCPCSQPQPEAWRRFQPHPLVCPQPDDPARAMCGQLFSRQPPPPWLSPRPLPSWPPPRQPGALPRLSLPVPHLPSTYTNEGQHNRLGRLGRQRAEQRRAAVCYGRCTHLEPSSTASAAALSASCFASSSSVFSCSSACGSSPSPTNSAQGQVASAVPICSFLMLQRRRSDACTDISPCDGSHNVESRTVVSTIEISHRCPRFGSFHGCRFMDLFRNNFTLHLRTTIKQDEH